MALLPMSKEQNQMVEDELEEYQLDFNEGLKQLKEWMSQQPHLPEYKDSDMKLKNFLYGRKFSLGRTKETIDNYYTMRGLLPEFLQNRDPTQHMLQYELEVVYFCMLPKLTKDGYRVYINGCHGPQLESKVPEDYYKLVLMFGDIILQEDFNRGLIFVVDVDKFTLAQIRRNTLPMLKKFMTFVQTSLPCRIKKIIIINAPTYFEFLSNMILLTLSQKLKERYFLFGKSEGYKPLVKLLGEDVCPSDYGGQGPAVETLKYEWKEKLESYRDWFLEQDTIQTDETKRGAAMKVDPTQIFGMTGSFRKLAVD